MFEELSWMQPKGIRLLFTRYSEDRLRDVCDWIDDQPQEIRLKVYPILVNELNRRAAEYYESKNHGEWL